VLEFDPAGIAAAASILQGGGRVAFATETVFGLGADARNGAAVASIFEAKERPAFNPLIVHLAQAAEARQKARALISNLYAAGAAGEMPLAATQHVTLPEDEQPVRREPPVAHATSRAEAVSFLLFIVSFQMFNKENPNRQTGRLLVTPRRHQFPM